MDAVKEKYLKWAERMLAAPDITRDQRKQVMAAVAYAKDGEQLRQMLTAIASRATGRSN